MFARLFDVQERAIGQVTSWSDWGGGGYTSSGLSVNRSNALTLLPVYGSAQLIVNEISTLPIDTSSRWIEQPTPDLNRIGWISQVLTSLLFDGNAYLRVYRGESNSVAGMLPLDPTRVRPWRVNGRKVFIVGGIVDPFEIIEIPAMMLPGAERGLSPIECARQSIGLGLAAQEYGAEFFDGSGNMPGVIEAPKVMQPGTKKEIAEIWRRKRSRGGKGLPGVLDDGATWKPTGVTNEQAQFLATRGFTAAEIAGQLFMVDPSELGIPVQGSNLTYANLQQRNTRRITFTCMPWIRRIETAIRPYTRGGFEFNVDARLRGDTKTSYETLAIALTAGFMTVDEVREILGFPPLPEGSLPTDVANQLAKSQMLALLKEAPNAPAA